ncbi:hypothetical protein EGW08_023458 [Elysia chlorotica]|uniref:Uncharacterized protein n=1 Tax=Elysia chlorotica TaxID=188477 RepID=A0A3S1AVZ6_ELYCH|nr:hypothetical protein EGW08_023458 [Elysia chlorotica]
MSESPARRNRWFGNKHSILDEFVHKRSRVLCEKCKENWTSRLYGEEQKGFCTKCRKNSTSPDGELIRISKVIDMNVLLAKNTFQNSGENMYFSKKGFVDTECVSFGSVNTLGFVVGDSELNDNVAAAFQKKAKRLVYDIETDSAPEWYKNFLDFIVLKTLGSSNMNADSIDFETVAAEFKSHIKPFITDENDETYDNIKPPEVLNALSAKYINCTKYVEVLDEKIMSLLNVFRNRSDADNCVRDDGDSAEITFVKTICKIVRNSAVDIMKNVAPKGLNVYPGAFYPEPDKAYRLS